MTPRRVAITGLGVVSSVGRNASDFWASLAAGRPGVRPIEAVDRSQFRFPNGAEVTGYEPLEHFTEREVSQLDRFAQFALLATREALAQARLGWTPALKQRTAVVTGSCVGGQTAKDRAFYELYKEGKPRVHPMMIPLVMANAGASAISLECGLQGPAFTISTACSSANHAIGQAFWMVRNGMADAAITGGSEAPFSLAFLKAWDSMRVVSPDTCRPFSKDRKGLILGEGAAILVLEPWDAAQARGAGILAEIVGCGMSSDAHHITQPLAEGAVLAMRMALDDSGVAPGQIGYINAHGTGTSQNDATETAAIRLVFGAHSDKLLVSSTKSMHGHALGAAGALEAAATILALRNGLIPPTANYTESDPACDLDVVPNQARAQQAEYALSNSFAFGGLNAVLAFRRA